MGQERFRAGLPPQPGFGEVLHRGHRVITASLRHQENAWQGSETGGFRFIERLPSPREFLSLMQGIGRCRYSRSSSPRYFTYPVFSVTGDRENPAFSAVW